MEEKITIIEGPPPTFEAVTDDWVLGLNEGAKLANVVLTRLRTFNGPALVERCHKAWRQRQMINLEYRSSDGLLQEAPIVACRTVETDDGQVLMLWLSLIDEDVELEMDYGDDQEDDEEN
jgi:hypothetical protein